VDTGADLPSSDRWASDRTIDLATVRAIAADRYPTVATANVEYLGSGLDFDVFRADLRVLRFPLRAEVDASLERRPRLGLQLNALFAPMGVLTPVLTITESGGHFPYRFTVHDWIDGVAADQARTDPLVIARRLGQALTLLHAGPGPEAWTLPIETDNAADWFSDVSVVADVLRPILGPEADVYLHWLLGSPPIPRNYEGPKRFLHNDICPNHVLVDDDCGALVGLIDFDDAAWGDPALDFVTMRAAMGAAFTDAMIDAYVLQTDPDFRCRIDFMARMKALDWLCDAHAQGTNVGKHRRWVRNAFS